MIFTSLPASFIFCVAVGLIMLFVFHFVGLWQYKQEMKFKAIKE